MPRSPVIVIVIVDTRQCIAWWDCKYVFICIHIEVTP